MNIPKYRIAHEYLIKRIQLRSGDVETPVQKYNRLLATRAESWQNENYDKRHLLRLKEIYKIRQLKEHLNWNENGKLKKDFTKKSVIHSMKLSLMSVLILIITIVASYSLWQWEEKQDRNSILKTLKRVEKEHVTLIEKDLMELSSRSIEFKCDVLATILADTSYIFRESLMPYIFQSLFSVSKEDKNLILNNAIDNMSLHNINKMSYFGSFSGVHPNIQKRFIDASIKLFEGAKDEEQKGRIANTLGGISQITSSAIEPLIEQLNTADDIELKSYIIYTLGEIGPSASPAVESLVKQLNTTDDIQLKKYIMYALGEIGPLASPAVESLVKQLNTTDDIQLKKYIMYALGEIGPSASPAVESLVKQLNTTDDIEINMSIIRSLGKLGVSAIEHLIKLLQTPKYDSYKNFIIQNLDISDSSASSVVDPLVSLLVKSNDEELQSNIALSLERIGAPASSAVEPLLRILNKTNNAVLQYRIISALGEIGPAAAPAIDSLIRLIDSRYDSYPSQNVNIFFALGGIGSAAIDPLLTLLNDSTYIEHQDLIIIALGLIGTSASKASDHLIEILINTDTDDYNLQEDLITTLGRIGASGAVDPLVNLLRNIGYDDSWDDRAFELRNSIVNALGNMGLEALPHLEQLFSETFYYRNKYYCLKGMLKIVPDNREYLKSLIEVFLPHPIVGYENKTEIIRIVGEIAGKEAAGENLDFDGDMWKMLDWWEEEKQTL